MIQLLHHLPFSRYFRLYIVLWCSPPPNQSIFLHKRFIVYIPWRNFSRDVLSDKYFLDIDILSTADPFRWAMHTHIQSIPFHNFALYKHESEFMTFRSKNTRLSLACSAPFAGVSFSKASSIFIINIRVKIWNTCSFFRA